MNSNTNPVDFSREFREIQAESIGWNPLNRGVYLHRGAEAGTQADTVIEIVGIADVNMAALNVLLLVY